MVGRHPRVVRDAGNGVQQAVVQCGERTSPSVKQPASQLSEGRVGAADVPRVHVLRETDTQRVVLLCYLPLVVIVSANAVRGVGGDDLHVVL